MRLKLFTDGVAAVKRHRIFTAGARTLTLTAIRDASGGAVARFAEVADRNAAEALRGTLLSVPRTSLPPLPDGEYYWHDLIGLPVITPDGEAVGEVAGVDNYGASDILDIAKAAGGSVLVPLIPAAVPDIGEKVVVAPEWLL